ncbi:MAG TPA: HAMP domain-containing sensor histidine kinase [Actinomycetota bacterium]
MAGSFRGRLGVALAATAFLSVALTAVVSLGLLRRSAADQARADLRRIAETLVGEGETLILDEVSLGAVRRVLAINGDELAVLGPGGIVAGRLTTPTGAAIAREIDVTPLRRGSTISGEVRIDEGAYVYVGVPVERGLRRGSRAIGAAILARPVSVAREVWGPAVGRVLLAAAAAVVLAIVGAAVLARTLTRPVRDLSRAAHRIAAGDLIQRVPVEGDDELGELASSFNEMTAGLAEAQRREREFLASVSHELRTPLTAIRGYAEALADGAVRGTAARADALRVIQAEADRLERMVSDVMDLARLGAADFRLEPRSVDLAETLRDAVATHGARAAEAGVSLESELPERLDVVTDPDRVHQVVSNLIENALRVTDTGGFVRVRARSSDGIEIEVADDGPGIARDDLPHVFERSYLWSRSKGVRPVGTGLGLAIVRELVTLLGGRVDVASTPGEGTTFRIHLDGAKAPGA